MVAVLGLGHPRIAESRLVCFDPVLFSPSLWESKRRRYRPPPRKVATSPSPTGVQDTKPKHSTASASSARIGPYDSPLRKGDASSLTLAAMYCFDFQFTVADVPSVASEINRRLWEAPIGPETVLLAPKGAPAAP